MRLNTSWFFYIESDKMRQACTWLISDLHLCETRPEVTAAFLAWISTEAVRAERLCILGDFFEVWLGDDAIARGQHHAVINALKALTEQGVELLVMHGNRDFLLSEEFAQATGARLLHDPTVIEWYGQRLLLTHGDAMCTDDVAYQTFKTQVRAPAWQAQFLMQSFEAREAFAAKARQQSGEATAMKAEALMDVNAQAVCEMFRANDYPVMIHGHTHRPHHHQIEVDGRLCERWVLGDWHTQASCLRLDEAGLKTVVLDLTL